MGVQRRRGTLTTSFLKLPQTPWPCIRIVICGCYTCPKRKRKGYALEESKFACPVCNEPLQKGQTECPRCGFKLIGRTEKFNPLSLDVADLPAEKPLGEPALEVVSGPYAGEHFVLGQGSYSLGRDPKCDVFLSNMTVSRHHATITIDGPKASITDAGSLNGTWVNGEVVDQAELTPGSRVQIGTFDMVFKFLDE